MDPVIVKMEKSADGQGYRITSTIPETIAVNGYEEESADREIALEQLNSLYCYMCETCTKVFSETCHEEGHTRSNTSINPLQDKEYTTNVTKGVTCKPSHDPQPCSHKEEKMCTYCPEQCSKNDKRATNWRIPEFGKPFSCIYCPQVFTRKAELVIHERVHTHENTMSCTYCPRVFSRKCSLEAHERTHIDPYDSKPFPCMYCEKSYKYRGSVRIHYERVHKGDINTL